MVTWILLAAVTLVVGSLTIARLVRVSQLSRPTLADPERLRDELLAFVERQGARVVDLRPFWDARPLSEADRWAVQGPLHQSGRLLLAEEDTSFFGRVRTYLRAPLPERVVLAHQRQPVSPTLSVRGDVSTPGRRRGRAVPAPTRRA
jgi:hypothetical protein